MFRSKGVGCLSDGVRWCWKPPPALHPCLDLYGFRGLSDSDRAPVFLFVLCTLAWHPSRPGGCTVWAGLGPCLTARSLSLGFRAGLFGASGLQGFEGPQSWKARILDASRATGLDSRAFQLSSKKPC